MLDKSSVRFRGKALDDLSVDELRAALIQALNRVAELEADQQARAAVAYSCAICGSADPQIHFTEHFTRR